MSFRILGIELGPNFTSKDLRKTSLIRDSTSCIGFSF